MKWGLIARGEDRGLGQITWEAHRNLHPDRTLLVDLGELSRGFPMHPERYPDATIVEWDGSPLTADQEAIVRGWLDGLDVLWSAETFYDWRIVDWAREAGVATVLLCMPEFYRQATETALPVPDAIWAPTTWRLDHLPEATRLVPVPVALDRFTLIPAADGPLRILHVAGHRAAADRNGTQLVLRALQHLTQRVDVTVAGQDGRLPSTNLGRARQLVTLRPVTASTPDYWDLYANQDVLVMPRRYGGLCLPVQEGMAAGLLPVMPDCSPNRDWPGPRIRARSAGTIATPCGQVQLYKVNPIDLAAQIDRLARDRAELRAYPNAAQVWAEAHSWEALGPLWLDELQHACDL